MDKDDSNATVTEESAGQVHLLLPTRKTGAAIAKHRYEKLMNLSVLW